LGRDSKTTMLVSSPVGIGRSVHRHQVRIAAMQGHFIARCRGISNPGHRTAADLPDSRFPFAGHLSRYSHTPKAPPPPQVDEGSGDRSLSHYSTKDHRRGKRTGAQHVPGAHGLV